MFNDNVKLSKYILSYVGLYGYLFFIIIYFILNQEIYKVIAVLLAMLALISEGLYFKKSQFKFYLLIFIVFCGLYSEALFKQSVEGINSYIMLFIHAGMALVLLNRTPSRKYINVIFWLCAGYFIILMFFGVSPSEAIFSRSRNHVSTLMIFVCAMWYISAKGDKQNIFVYPSIVTFIICIWAMGRSGIIASGVLLGGIIFFYNNKRTFYIIALILIILFAVFVGSSIDLPFHEKSFTFTKFFDRQLTSDVRFTIINKYLEKMGIQEFFLGYDWKELSYFFEGENLHNTYLSAHFRMGIFAILIIGMIMVAYFKSFYISKLYFVLLTSILLRGFGDTIMIPNGLFDFILYYLVGYSLCVDTRKIQGEISIGKN